MGIMGGAIGYRLLRLINPTGESAQCSGRAYQGRSKLEILFGPQIWSELEGKVVVDFGCGSGAEAIEIAQRGARKVIGIDIRESALAEARRKAARENVAERCLFTVETREKADVILSLDAFDHFEDPGAILQIMRGLLHDGGCAIIGFGPTWYHPFGGHLFSVFPWAHLLFTEQALLRWRSDFKSDGACRFDQVEGQLNQMTIRRFEKLVACSEFEFASYETVPIRRLRFLCNPLTREFFTAFVRCRLVPRSRRVLGVGCWVLGPAGEARTLDASPPPAPNTQHPTPGAQRP